MVKDTVNALWSVTILLLRLYLRVWIFCYCLSELFYVRIDNYVVKRYQYIYSAGKRFDSAPEQTTLCSFHPRSGGLGINIDYETQLNVMHYLR